MPAIYWIVSGILAFIGGAAAIVFTAVKHPAISNWIWLMMFVAAIAGGAKMGLFVAHIWRRSQGHASAARKSSNGSTQDEASSP